MWVMRHEWFGVSRKTPKFTRCEKGGEGKDESEMKSVFSLCLCPPVIVIFY